MKWLQTASLALRGIGVTATALAIIWVQLLLWAIADRAPNDAWLATAFGLLGLPVYEAVRTVLGVPKPSGRGSSSPSPQQPPSPPSPPSSQPEVGTGE